MLDRRSFMLATAASLAAPMVRPSWAALPQFVVTKPMEAIVEQATNQSDYTFDSRLAAHPKGGFMLSYSPFGTSTVLRRYGADGNTIGAELSTPNGTVSGSCLVPAPDGVILIQSGRQFAFERREWSGNLSGTWADTTPGRGYIFPRATRLSDGSLLVAWHEAKVGGKPRARARRFDFGPSPLSETIDLTDHSTDVGALVPSTGNRAIFTDTVWTTTGVKGRVRTLSPTGPGRKMLTFALDSSVMYVSIGLVRLPQRRIAVLVPRKTHVHGGIYDLNLNLIRKLERTPMAGDRMDNAPKMLGVRSTNGSIVCPLPGGITAAWSPDTGKLVARTEGTHLDVPSDIVRLRDGTFAATGLFEGQNHVSALGCFALR